MNATELRAALATRTPYLWNSCACLAEKWTVQIRSNLDTLPSGRIAFPKTFTDPVLGPIELFEWEVAILDSPLLQRLRGVRQLGMAHAVYTGATHDRLSHTLGVIEVAQRMVNALKKNARYHTTYGTDKDPDVPLPAEDEVVSIRLAALLHDVGHGPFSHASEPLIEQRHAKEFALLRDILRTEFPGAEKIRTSEAIAVLITLSEPVGRVFEHARFHAPVAQRDELAIYVAARLLGSWRALRATYLVGVISGPLDADKLDYMARDSYFTGLPLGLDVERLINKLEIITITPERVADPSLKERAANQPNQRLYQLGLSVAGLTAYEQMIIGRVLLYDRVYYHHKVRCAEAMVRQLFRVAEDERKAKFSLEDLLTNINDDSMVYLLGGDMKVDGISGGTELSSRLSNRIRVRRFYHRAFAFAERFLAGLQALTEEEQKDTRSLLWQHILEALADDDSLDDLAQKIFSLCESLQNLIPELNEGAALHRHDIVVDLANIDPVDSSRNVFMRTEGGELTYANLFFDPDRWSEAYKNQKKCGYVFAPRRATTLVALASQILMFDRFGVVMSAQARHLCKIGFVPTRTWTSWLQKALDASLCTPECFSALSEEKPKLVPVRPQDLRFPPDWTNIETQFRERLALEFDNAFGGGFEGSFRDHVISDLEHFCYVIDAFEKGGDFVKRVKLDEKRQLQSEIAKALRLRGCETTEAQEIAGGETDLVLPGKIVVENKVEGVTTAINDLKPDAPWQSRRYSIALNRRIFFVVIAYKPQTEAQILPLPKRVSVHRLVGAGEECLYVRFLIPWGTDVPSKANKPK